MARPSIRQLSFADVEISAQAKDMAAGGPLLAIAAILDQQQDLVAMVYRDLIAGLKKPTTGRDGLDAVRVLRAFILCQIEDLDLRSLRSRICDGISWRVFTTFYAQAVPDHNAFARAFSRLTPDTVRKINEALVRKAVDLGVEDGEKLRVDTMVVESNIRFPTDGGLLWDSVRVITREVNFLGDEVPRAVLGFKDHTRQARRRYQEIARMTRAERHTQQLPKYRDLIKLTETVVAAARAAVTKANTKKAHSSSAARALRIGVLFEKLAHYCSLADRVIDQSRRRVLQGEQVPVKDKVFSIFEPHTDCIVRGKAQKPVEFGHKVFLAESGHGLITEYRVLTGNPIDETHVRPSLECHQTNFGHAPELYAADRGFYSPDALDACRQAGVQIECIPQRGGIKSTDRQAYEKSRAFKEGQRFRAGIEGRISVLMRGRGMRRCLRKGLQRFDVYVGVAVLANNVVILARLLADMPSARTRAA